MRPVKLSVIALLVAWVSISAAHAQYSYAVTPPTTPSCDNSKKIATTAFVNACGGLGSGMATSGANATSAALGNIAAADTGQAANSFLGTPNGTTGAPALRTLVAADIPSLSSLYNGVVTWPTTGDLLIAGGNTPTGLAPTNNDLIYATGGAFASLATANSSVLVTSAGGVPSLSTTLPSGLTIPGFNASITWPTTSDLMIAGGNSPTGLAPVNGDCVVGSGGAWTAGSCGGSTSFTAHPGLGNSLTTFNAGTQTVTTDLYPNNATYSVTSAYTINATTGTTPCSVAALCDTARVILADGSASIAITAPNPAGTLAPYQIADQAGHGFTVPTVGGTATFFGCVSGSPTTLTVPANYGVQLFDQGSGANTYFCAFQPLTQIAGTSGANPTATAGPSANNGSATTFMRSDASPAVQVGSSSQEGILQCGSGTTCSAGTISVSGGGSSIGTGYYTGANYYYLPLGLNNMAAGGGVAANTIYCASGTTLNSITLEALAMDVTTIDSTPGHAQLAVYDNTGTGHRPGALLFSTASISEATLGMISTSVTAGSLPAGGYWFCINQDGTTAKYEANNNASTLNSIPSVFVGSGTLANMAPGAPITGTSTPETFGTWPSLASATWTDITALRAPIEWVQAQ